MAHSLIKRSKTLTLNLSEDEMGALEALARERGVNKSVLLREWIRKESSLDGGLPDATGGGQGVGTPVRRSVR